MICWNRLNELSAFVNAIVLIPIKGFALVPPSPQVYGQTFFIECQLETGSELVLYLEWDKTIKIPAEDPTKFKITPELYSAAGLYKFEVVGSNLLTPAITLNGEVLIDKEIKGMNVKISQEKNTV